MPPTAKPPDVPPALAKALQLHQQGKLAEATPKFLPPERRRR